jgi:hypothetical protein
MKHLLRLKIKLIRWMRGLGYLHEPKRTYTYDGKQYQFYKAPVHGTTEGALYIDEKELLNSVMFHKTLRRAMDSSISHRIKVLKFKKKGEGFFYGQ